MLNKSYSARLTTEQPSKNKDLINFGKFYKVKGQIRLSQEVTSVSWGSNNAWQNTGVGDGVLNTLSLHTRKQKCHQIRMCKDWEEEVTSTEKRQDVEKTDFWSWEKGHPTVRLYPVSGKGFQRNDE